MPKVKVVDHKFRQATVERIVTVNSIIEEYANLGLDITLRQLYYQLVARDMIPNDDREYDRLGTAIRKGREAGLIDWYALVDRTRFLRTYSSWDDGIDMLDMAANQFAMDMWADQESMVEAWVEKDALIGVLAQACDPIKVPHFSCRGYSSASEIFIAAQRIKRYQRAGQWPIIFILLDHDPSGMDMGRDLKDRLELYGAGRPTSEVPDSPTTYKDGRLAFGADFTIKRIALNMAQVQTYNPPPNPVKLKDSRSHGPKGYLANFGRECWELDALRPTVMRDLIQEWVEQVKNQDTWDEVYKAQERDREKLKLIRKNYHVINFGFHLEQATCPNCDETMTLPGGYEFFECDYCGLALSHDRVTGQVIETPLDVSDLLHWEGVWKCPKCDGVNETVNNMVKDSCWDCKHEFWLGPVDSSGDREVFHEVNGSDPDEDFDEDEDGDDNDDS